MANDVSARPPITTPPGTGVARTRLSCPRSRWSTIQITRFRNVAETISSVRMLGT